MKMLSCLPSAVGVYNGSIETNLRGARAKRLSATGLCASNEQRYDSLFLDGTEELETGQEFTLGHRSLDDGRHDGDVEVGRADVLRRRDASDVDVYIGGDLTLAIAPPDNLDLDPSPFLRPTWFWGMMI